MSAGARAGAPPAGDQFQPQELVITMLGTYVRPHGELVWSGGLVVLLGELGFSEGAARVAFTRLVRRGLLTRTRDGRLVHYRLTARAHRLLAEGDRRIFTLGHAREDEGAWTVLCHQIPEHRRLERTRLARRLRFLGFGSVQDSVWISPRDHCAEVTALLADLDVSDTATVFTARPEAVAGLPALVARAWDLTGLAERYQAFDAEFSPLVGGRGGRRGGRTATALTATALTDRQAFLVRTRMVHRYRAFPEIDPELPEALAPVSGARERAAAIFEELYERLAPASQRHFDAATAGYAATA